jgi:hypothetical protein
LVLFVVVWCLGFFFFLGNYQGRIQHSWHSHTQSHCSSHTSLSLQPSVPSTNRASKLVRFLVSFIVHFTSIRLLVLLLLCWSFLLFAGFRTFWLNMWGIQYALWTNRGSKGRFANATTKDEGFEGVIKVQNPNPLSNILSECFRWFRGYFTSTPHLLLSLFFCLYNLLILFCSLGEILRPCKRRVDDMFLHTGAREKR